MNVPLFCLPLSFLFALLQRSVAGLQLVSIGKNITSSSTHADWIAARTIDGDARRAASVCYCCASTTNELEPWYQLDLGQSYMVHTINVLGRSGDVVGNSPGYGHTLQNMEIKLGTRRSGGDVLTTNTADVYTFNYTLPTPTSARYLTLTLRDTAQYFIICELYVYAECNTNTYGDGCTQPCGNCLKNETCHSDDGKCTSCAAGYQGDTCKQECNEGYFGQGCSSQCFCDGITCDPVNGICSPGNCQSGYQGQKCDTECDDGYFGGSCSRQCYCEGNPCNKETGVCQSGKCQPGYQGSMCETQCDDSYYGVGCTSHCYYEGDPCNKVTGVCPSECNEGYFGQGCLSQCFCEGITCDPVNGICPPGNCQSGYQGQKCDTECEDGKYGQDCIMTCGHCLNGTPCDKINGTCPLLLCEADYEGHDCGTRKVARKVTESLTCPSLGLVIGGTILGLISVEVFVAAIWFLLKKRKQSNQKKKSTEDHYDIPIRENAELEHPYGPIEDVNAPAYINTELRA